MATTSEKTSEKISQKTSETVSQKISDTSDIKGEGKAAAAVPGATSTQTRLLMRAAQKGFPKP